MAPSTAWTVSEPGSIAMAWATAWSHADCGSAYPVPHAETSVPSTPTTISDVATARTRPPDFRTGLQGSILNTDAAAGRSYLTGVRSAGSG